MIMRQTAITDLAAQDPDEGDRREESGQRHREDTEAAPVVPGVNKCKHQEGQKGAAEKSDDRFDPVKNEIADKMLSAFRTPNGAEFLSLDEKYGCTFGLSSRAYWSSCFAVAADAKAVSCLMEYFQDFIFTLLEFSYMGTRNPNETYVWRYYDSFQKILSELSTPLDVPLAVKVCSLGGTTGKRDNDGYDLAFGLDIHNPNPNHMAWNVKVDVNLKDREGNLITSIHDRINCIDPNGIFHYGVTRRIHGAAVAHISASAKAENFSKLSTPLMKHIVLSKISINRQGNPSMLNGTLKNNYDCSLHSYALHYQFLNPDNKILGGHSEWFFEEFPQNTEKTFSIPCTVEIPKGSKVVYSIDFNAQDLL